MAIPEARGPPGYKFLPSSGPISAHLAAVDVTRVSRTTSLASPEASRQHSSSGGHTSAPISLACCPRRSQAGLLSKSNADTSPAEKQSGLSRRSSTMHLQYHHGFVVVGHTLSPFSGEQQQLWCCQQRLHPPARRAPFPLQRFPVGSEAAIPSKSPSRHVQQSANL